MKKILLLSFSLIIILSMSILAFADQTSTQGVNNVNYIEYDDVLLNALSNSESLDGVAAKEIKNTKSKSDIETSSVQISTLSPLFIRQAPDSTVVQVYLTYSGSEFANAVKFSEMTIQNTSLIFQVTYGSLTPKVYSFDFASNYYNCYLGNINIPVDVTKVRVQDSGMSAYYISLQEPGWNSFSNIMGEWTIH